MALMNLYSGKQWRNRHSGRRAERRGDVWWSNIEIYNTMCKADSHRNLLYDSGNSNGDWLKSGVGREKGGRSERKETWMYLWLILIDV